MLWTFRVWIFISVVNFGQMYQFDTYEDLIKKRQNIFEKEENIRYGHTEKAKFTDDENRLNEILLRSKRALIEANRDKVTYDFWPSQNFIDLPMALVPENELYQMLLRLPKGALLHAHLMYSNNVTTFLQAAFAHPQCLVTSGGSRWFLTFPSFNPDPELFQPCPSRASSEYDLMMQVAIQHLTLYDGTKYDQLSSSERSAKFKERWKRLQKIGKTPEGIRIMTNTSLETILQDNIQYVEYRLDGHWVKDAKLDSSKFIAYWEDYRRRVVEQHKAHFFGFDIILTQDHSVSRDQLKLNLNSMQTLFGEFDMVVGFDFGGSNQPWQLQNVSDIVFAWQQSVPEESRMPLVLFCGEDINPLGNGEENAVEALLLNTRRIGTPGVLNQHVELLKDMRDGKVGLVLTPINDQVERGIKDLRNHESNQFFPVAEAECGNSSATGDVCEKRQLIAVSSEQSMILGSRPLTDDLYELMLGIVPVDGGLEVVKQFVLDSIDMCLLSDAKKTKLRNLTMTLWHEEVRKIMDIYDSGGNISHPGSQNLVVNSNPSPLDFSQNFGQYDVDEASAKLKADSPVQELHRLVLILGGITTITSVWN